MYTGLTFCFDIDGTLCPIKKKEEEYIDLVPYKEMLEKVNYGDTQDLVAILNETIERYNNLCGTLEEDRLEYERLLKEQSMINAECRKEMEEILRKMR